MKFERTDATLGAIVTGVTLAALRDDEWREIEALFLDAAVLVFPDQHLSEEEQTTFARRFGEIDLKNGMAAIGNRKPDGTVLEKNDPLLGLWRVSENWHTDSSYEAVSAQASMLSAHVVPAEGGQTEWADMRAAYEALDEATRARVGGLSASHSIRASLHKVGAHELAALASDSLDGSDAVPRRPLVKVHPQTKRPSLYLGVHAFGLPGMDEEASARFLADLTDRACQPPRVYRHEWQVGDLVVWDNRCVLHRGIPYDFAVPRLMKHTRIQGDPASEGASS